ncbi:acyltransferase family protein [Rhodopila sp.]|uniref:acyltransferase family protein n=1 Tax=Rhodopila sp. TaxID=2480087 RepID=UPI003D0DC770
MTPILLGATVALLCATMIGSLATAVGFPLPPNQRRIGCIDGLRGYLALFVLVHHFIIWVQIVRLHGAWAALTANLLNNLGAGGVALFFMTTGLVFYPRVLAGFGATSWVATYTTRAFRLIPLLAFSVLLLSLVIALRTGNRPNLHYVADFLQWISCRATPPLLGYADSGRLDAYVLWSLNYEWMFYLFVLPACALMIDATRGRGPTWALPVALLVLSLAARPLFPAWGLSRYLPLFIVGMLAYEAQRTEAIRRLLSARWMAIPAGLCLLVGLVSAPTPYEIPHLALIGLFFASVACGNGFGGALRTKGARALGECSYGIYLLHGIALNVLFTEGSSFTDRFSTSQIFALLPVVAAGVTCVTLLTYVLIERPLIRAGGRIAKLATKRSMRIDSPQIELAP